MNNITIISILVGIMAVCAVFVVITPIVTDIFKNKINRKIKTLEKKLDATAKQTEELDNSLKNLYSNLPNIYAGTKQKSKGSKILTKL
jgi:cell division protein FtsL